MSHFQSRRDGFSFPACPPYVRDGAKESGERGDGSASVTLDRLPISLYTVAKQVYKEVRCGGGRDTTNFNDVTQSSKFTLIYAILTLILGLLNC